MNFSEIFKKCLYKGKRETEGFYKDIFICHHPESTKKYCSMNCPILKEFERNLRKD
jgi:hypothetical protein